MTDQQKDRLTDERIEAAISSIEDWISDGLSEEAFDLNEVLSAYTELQSRRASDTSPGGKGKPSPSLLLRS